jgi:hypothetical protein
VLRPRGARDAPGPDPAGAGQRGGRVGGRGPDSPGDRGAQLSALSLFQSVNLLLIRRCCMEAHGTGRVYVEQLKKKWRVRGRASDVDLRRRGAALGRAAGRPRGRRRLSLRLPERRGRVHSVARFVIPRGPDNPIRHWRSLKGDHAGATGSHRWMYEGLASGGLEAGPPHPLPQQVDRQRAELLSLLGPVCSHVL